MGAVPMDTDGDGLADTHREESKPEGMRVEEANGSLGRCSGSTLVKLGSCFWVP